MHYVRDHERSIRVPRWLRSLERRYTKAWEELAALRHAEPTPAHLSEALGVEVDVIHQLQAIRGGNRHAEINDESPRAVFQCDALPAPTQGALSIEERLTVIIAIDELPARERTVVLGTFAAGLSQAQIAASLGLSQSQVSKILNRALGKLQRRVA
jgi:RNA polymerase sigma factor (sigma-70 family)